MKTSILAHSLHGLVPAFGHLHRRCTGEKLKLLWLPVLLLLLPTLLPAATPPGYPVYPSQSVSWLVVGGGTETWTAQENGFKSVSVNTSGISQGDKEASFVAEQSGSATLTFTGSASGGGTSSLTVYKLNAFGNRDTVYSRSFTMFPARPAASISASRRAPLTSSAATRRGVHSAIRSLTETSAPPSATRRW